MFWVTEKRLSLLVAVPDERKCTPEMRMGVLPSLVTRNFALSATCMVLPQKSWPLVKLQLVGATLPRIDKKAREGAQRVIAQSRTNPAAPLARVDFVKERDMVRPEDTSAEHVKACQELWDKSGGFFNAGVCVGCVDDTACTNGDICGAGEPVGPTAPAEAS